MMKKNNLEIIPQDVQIVTVRHAIACHIIRVVTMPCLGESKSFLGLKHKTLLIA